MSSPLRSFWACPPSPRRRPSPSCVYLSLSLSTVQLTLGPSIQWRYLLFFALLLSEATLILGPSLVQAPSAPALPDTPESAAPLEPDGASGWLTWAFPARVPFQHVLLLHQLFMFASVAVSRVVPVVWPAPPSAGVGGEAEAKMMAPIMERLGAVAGGIDSEGECALVFFAFLSRMRANAREQ
jgi:hypothetical protein